ncbi:MAG: hypothetical protein F9Y92_06205 [Thermoplasmatales archaeon]|nr:hypothetical protein [Thermoplasmatales archaeon]
MQHISAFYEGLFASISKSTQAESYLPSNENIMIEYYLSLIESVIMESNNNIQSQRYDNITAYLSADFDGSRVKFYTVNYTDEFGSTIKQFISTIESKLVSAKDVIVEYAGKVYEIAKDTLIKVLNTLNEVFIIAKNKFNEALRYGKHVLENVAKMLKLGFDNLRQAFFTAVAYASNALKTIFAAKKAKLESTNIYGLQNYSTLPLSYFVGKLFNEYMFNSELYDKITKEDFGFSQLFDHIHGGGGSSSGDSSIFDTIKNKVKSIFGGEPTNKKEPTMPSDNAKSVLDPYLAKHKDVAQALKEFEKQQTPQSLAKLINTVTKNNTFTRFESSENIENTQKFNTRLITDIINKYIVNYGKKYNTDKMIADLLENGDIKLKDQLIKNLDNNKTLIEALKKYKESFKHLKGIYPERMEMPEHFVSQYIDFLEKETGKITDGLDKAINAKFNKYLADKPQSKDLTSRGSLGEDENISNVTNKLYSDATEDAYNEYLRNPTFDNLIKLLNPYTNTAAGYELNDKEAIELYKENVKTVNNLIEQAINEFDKKYTTDQMIAEAIKNNDLNLEDQLMKKIEKDKQFIENLNNYKENLKNLYANQPALIEEPMKNADKLTALLEKDVENAKMGIEIVKNIENNKLLAENIFRYGIYVVASTGMLYLAYRIAKGFNPIYSLLKAAGLTIGLMVILFAVKYVVEYYVPLSAKIKEIQSGNVAVQPDEILSLVFLVSLGILIGSIVIKATVSLDDERRAGAKAGRMLATL